MARGRSGGTVSAFRSKSLNRFAVGRLLLLLAVCGPEELGVRI